MDYKVGRNDPCPCGSGKKYKNCHYGKELKKTYTQSGKRKFKASVLSVTDKSQSIFMGTPTAPRPPIEAPPLDYLKFKMAKKDYRESSLEAPIPFSLPEHEKLEKPTIEHETPQMLPEEFKLASEDFREKKEGQ